MHFSADEWPLLEGWQKALHQEVMQENYTLLLSLGEALMSLVLRVLHPIRVVVVVGCLVFFRVLR